MNKSENPKIENNVHLHAEVGDVLMAWLAEYDALRKEIEWLINDGSRYQNFAITLLGIIGGVIGWLLNEASVLLLPTLLVTPFIFCLLGFLYLRQHEEVFVVAAYLKNYVRPRIRELVGDMSLWGWEEFKCQRWDSNRGQQSRTFEINDLVFLLRGMLFIMPSVAALIVGLLIVLKVPPFPTLTINNWSSALFILLGFLLDIILTLLLTYYLFFRGRNMPKELSETNS